MDFAYLKKSNYRLIASDLSKQKALDADSRAIQHIIFTSKVDAVVDASMSFKRNCVRILQRNNKSSVISMNG